VESENAGPIYEQERNKGTLPPFTPNRLGFVKHVSIDQDWALIEITEDGISSDLALDASNQERSSHINQSMQRTGAVVCNKSRGSGTYGTLSPDASYMRLPWSSTFQGVYRIALDSAIAWGDCGSVILDEKTRAFCGHIVASSEDRRTAFVMPASRLLESAGMSWQSPEVIEISRPLTTARNRSPKYIFRIDEIEPHKDHISDPNRAPVVLPEAYVKSSTGASGRYWYCNGDAISQLPNEHSMSGVEPYRTFSTIYIGGRGFWFLEGDATDPSKDGAWRGLQFSHDGRTNSSAVTNDGKWKTLQKHSQKARWPRMLLPDIYHNPEDVDSDTENKYSSGDRYVQRESNSEGTFGGLTGDLPIFLALIAFSMGPEMLATELPTLMHDGQWLTHTRAHGRKYNLQDLSE
jgi:hypothetical protein